LAVEAAVAPSKPLFYRFGCQESPGHHGHEGDGELEGLSVVPLGISNMRLPVSLRFPDSAHSLASSKGTTSSPTIAPSFASI
jgi:hypothetical protein